MAALINRGGHLILVLLSRNKQNRRKLTFLGLEDADELLTRSKIGFFVFQVLEQKKLRQREIADILGIAQPDVSYLMPEFAIATPHACLCDD